MKVQSGLVSAAILAAMVLGVSTSALAGPPLPFHTIEGVGGGAITPIAYLVNPEPDGALFKKPAVAMSFVNLADKNLTALTITEMVGDRIEIGYAADRLGMGTLPGDIQETTHVNIETGDVWLHNFNVRMLFIEENTSFLGLAMPAVTGGVHFKVNEGIRDIDNRLGGALSGIGYERENGTDFTLTATRTIPPKRLGLPGPLIVSAGLRASQAAQLGLLGFGDDYKFTFEGNACYFVTERLLLAYEYRQKTSPYGEIAGLVGDEDDWHAIDVAAILSERDTLCVGWGHFGLIANTESNGTWWLQWKHNF